MQPHTGSDTRSVDMIDQYVRTLHRLVAGSRGSAQIVAAVREQLEQSAAGAEAAGAPRADAEAEAVRAIGAPKEIALRSVRWYPLVISRSAPKLALLLALVWGLMGLVGLTTRRSDGQDLVITSTYLLVAAASALQVVFYRWRRRRDELVEVPSRAELPSWQKSADAWTLAAAVPLFVAYVVAWRHLDAAASVASLVLLVLLAFIATMLIRRWAWRRHLASPWS